MDRHHTPNLEEMARGLIRLRDKSNHPAKGALATIAASALAALAALNPTR